MQSAESLRNVTVGKDLVRCSMDMAAKGLYWRDSSKRLAQMVAFWW